MSQLAPPNTLIAGTSELAPREEFVHALADDFAINGVAAIQRSGRTNKPEVYLRVVADLLPKDMTLNVSHYDNMTDAQLLARLRQVNKLAGPMLAIALADDGETLN